MQVLANAYLGPRPPWERSLIGYRVLDAQRQEVKGFSTLGVERGAADGWFAVAGPVEVPDSGGFVVWGTQRGQVLAEEAFQPAPQLAPQPAPVVSLPQSLVSRLDALLEAVGAMVAAMPADRSATLAEMTSELSKTRADMALLLKATISGHGIVAEQAVKEERKRVAGYLDKFLESVGAGVN